MRNSKASIASHAIPKPADESSHDFRLCDLNSLTGRSATTFEQNRRTTRMITYTSTVYVSKQPTPGEVFKFVAYCPKVPA
jgi:hypothetical protein